MTDRRVAISLSFASDSKAGNVLANVLSTLDPRLLERLAGTNTYAFDPTDHTDETRAHLVLWSDGSNKGIFIDDEDAALDHAKAIGGIVVELHVAEDFRAKAGQE